MKNENVRFRAGPLPEDFIRGDDQQYNSFKAQGNSCALHSVWPPGCRSRPDWFGTPKTGKLRLLLYCLCETRGALPDVLRKIQVVALGDFVALVC